jgi:alkaline phosphatase
MTERAIAKMKDHPNGFVLQVETGKSRLGST